MGRNNLNKVINPDSKIGIRFPIIGSDYSVLSDYTRVTIDTETGKPIKLTKFLGCLVKRTAADIRAGKKIRV